jgi:chromosome partitioning protein
MASVLAIANQKGGVGKTTTVVNLAAALSLANQRVLVVDLDPQANASSAFGAKTGEASVRLYDALIGQVPVSEILVETEHSGLHLLSSGPELVALEIELIDAPRRAHYLRDLLAPERASYDYILIDCAPSLGLLTVNALVAADYVLVPLQAEYYALEGVSGLLRTIDAITQTEHPSLSVLGFILTMVDRRNRICHQVAEEARAFFGDRVFETYVPRNVRLAEAPSHGKTALAYDLNCSGSLAYMTLAEELIARLDPRQGGEGTTTQAA